MTMHRADQLGQHSVEWPAALGLQRAGFAGGGDTPPDPVEAYFECITTCSSTMVTVSPPAPRSCGSTAEPVHPAAGGWFR